MSTPLSPDAQGSPTRPYLIRALHDWCTDNGFTPYLAVFVDGSVQVPTEYVKNQEIVLNVGFEATSGLQLGNEFIEFKARFGGVARDIVVPVGHVVAIYARENGQGMAFPAPASSPLQAPGAPPEAVESGAAPSRPAAPVISLSKSDSARAAVSAAPTATPSASSPAHEAADGGGDPAKPPTGGRPALKRVK